MLRGYHIWAMAILLSMAMGQYACTSLPPTSTTSAISDVRIDDSLSRENLQVRSGDEVRWINLRKEPVQIEIHYLKAEDLSCEREFSSLMGSIIEIAVLKTNASASLCFNKPTVINYVVRLGTVKAGPKKILNGVINVRAADSQ